MIFLTKKYWRLFMCSTLSLLILSQINSTSGAIITTTVREASILTNNAVILVDTDYALEVDGYSANHSLTGGNQISLTQTSGDTYSSAVHVHHNGDLTLGNDTRVNASGINGATGLWAGDLYGETAQSTMTLGEGTQIEVSTSSNGVDGVGAAGASAISGATMTLGSFTDIKVAGHQAAGLYVWGNGKINIASNLSIEANGIESKGVWSFMDYGETFESVITLSPATKIVAIGDYSKGVMVGDDGLFPPIILAPYSGGIVNLDTDTHILVSGKEAYGVFATEAGTVNMAGGSISALGQDSLSLYAKDTLSQILGTGSFQISGDMVADTSGAIDLTLLNGSHFVGATNNNIGAGTVDLKFMDSHWNMTNDSSITNLTLTNSDLTFEKMGGFAKPTVSDTLSGTGTIQIHSDISRLSSDQLFIANGSGNFLLDIQNRGSTPPITQVLPIITVDNPGSETFSLAHLVDAGAYQFKLSPFTSNSYNLIYNGTYSTTAQTVPNTLRASYMLNYAESNSLMKRMGDLRSNSDQGNIWARVFGGSFDVNTNHFLKSFKQQYTGLQVGMDKKIVNTKGDIYLGALLGHTKGTNDYFENGDGTTTSYYGGIYGSYFKEKNHFYVDTILKLGSSKNELRLTPASGQEFNDNDSAFNWNFSLESGRRFFKNSKTKQGFYLEPQMKLSFSQINRTDYELNHTTVELDKVNSVLGRVGMLAGYELNDKKIHSMYMVNSLG